MARLIRDNPYDLEVLISCCCQNLVAKTVTIITWQKPVSNVGNTEFAGVDVIFFELLRLAYRHQVVHAGVRAEFVGFGKWVVSHADDGLNL